MQNRFSAILSALLLVIMAGCSGSNSPTIPVWGYFNVVTGTEVLAGRDSVFSVLVGQFQNETNSTNPTLSVDSITMNQLSLAFLRPPYGYYQLDTTAQLPGDPQFNWHIVGAGSIPSFDNTVTGPEHLRLNLPHFGDTVYALNGILVNWSPTVTNGTVYLEIDDIHNNTLWPTNAEGPQGYPDNGSAIISKGNLAGIPPQPIRIYAYRFNSSQKQVGQQLFNFTCYSESAVTGLLKP